MQGWTEGDRGLKDLRQLNGRLNEVGRRKEQKQWEGREVLEEPVWEALRSPEEANEILDYTQQNHAKKKEMARVGRV